MNTFTVEAASTTCSVVPPMALKVVVSRISSNSTGPSDLKGWFESVPFTRYVKVNDTICLENESGELSLFMISSVVMPESANDLTVAGVDVKSTKVVQHGEAYGPFPLGIRRFLGVNNFPTAHQFPDLKTVADTLRASMDPTFASRLRNTPCTILVSGKAKSGKKNALQNVAMESGFHLCIIDCWEVEMSSQGSEANVLERLDAIFKDSVGPTLLVFDHIDAFIQEEREDESLNEPSITLALESHIYSSCAAARAKSGGFPLVVAATVNNLEKLTPGLRSCFQHYYQIQVFPF